MPLSGPQAPTVSVQSGGSVAEGGVVRMLA